MQPRRTRSARPQPNRALTPLTLAGLVVACMMLGIGAGILHGHLTDQLHHSADAVSGQIPVESFAAPGEGIHREIARETSDAPAWRAHAGDFAANDAPRLAIVVVDEGRDAAASLRAMRMDVPLTLAIAPGIEGARSRAEAARRFGREVLLLLPMGAANKLDTAPNPIRRNLDRDEVLRRLAWHLAQLDGYAGVANQYGSETSRDPATMRVVMEALREHGLMFLDSRTHPESVAGAVARRMGVPAGDRDAGVDSGAQPEAVLDMLSAAERHAADWGHAIVTVPAERDAVDALKRWFRTRNKSIAIAPVSAVVARLRTGES